MRPEGKYKTQLRILFYEHDKLNFMANKFTIGLVQMRSTANAEENLSRAVEKIREASARGAQIICMDELFRGEYFCRTENSDLFNLAEPDSRPFDGRAGENREGKKSRPCRFTFRAPRRRHLSQHLRRP